MEASQAVYLAFPKLTLLQGLRKPLGFIDTTTFPLLVLGPILRDLSKELHRGRGFFLLRGVEVDKYTREDNIIIFTGLSSYIGSIRGRQQVETVDDVTTSTMLNHIKDFTDTSPEDAAHAPAYTRIGQPFHTDAGDIVALFSLDKSASGGESKLASTWRVYNELARTRPDIIHTLANDWVFDGYGNPLRFDNSMQPLVVRPLIYHQPSNEHREERIIIQYARRPFTGFGDVPRPSDIPPVNEVQAEAMDALHYISERNCIAFDLNKGDIQYINNLSIFHARNEFLDSAEQQRHFLRLWLRDPEYCWETPKDLKGRWDDMYKDVTPLEQTFPLEPVLKSSVGKS